MAASIPPDPSSAVPPSLADEPDAQSGGNWTTGCGWQVDPGGEKLLRRVRLVEPEATSAFLDLLRQLARLAGLPVAVDIEGGRVEGTLTTVTGRKESAGDTGGPQGHLDLYLEVDLGKGSPTGRPGPDQDAPTTPESGS